MDRGVRVLRGSLGATIATLVAALSHALAGGVITPASVLATIIATLPLCVWLAGRVGSLWRLTLAVGASQFLYHWTFAGLGLVTGTGPGVPMSPHAAHFAALQSFTPDLVAAGAADVAMWSWHVVAACLTIVLLHRGERAFVALCRVLRRALPDRAAPTLTPALRRTAPHLGAIAGTTLHELLSTAMVITRRGPPHAA